MCQTLKTWPDSVSSLYIYHLQRDDKFISLRLHEWLKSYHIDSQEIEVKSPILWFIKIQGMSLPVIHCSMALSYKNGMGILVQVVRKLVWIREQERIANKAEAMRWSRQGCSNLIWVRIIRTLVPQHQSWIWAEPIEQNPRGLRTILSPGKYYLRKGDCRPFPRDTTAPPALTKTGQP